MPIALILDDPEEGHHPDRRRVDRSRDLGAGSSHHTNPTPGSALVSEFLQEQREKEGRCAFCGIQTHQVLADHQTKTALTIQGEVYRGRCLLCYPVVMGNAAGTPTDTTSSGLTDSEEFDSWMAEMSEDDVVMTKAATQDDETDFLDDEDLTEQSSHLAQPKNSTSEHVYDVLDVLNAMKRFPQDVYIQSKGCERLWILSWDEDNAAAIGRVGGSILLLDAMTNFPQDTFLQLCGCEALQNLSHVESTRQDLCDLGAVPLIVRAMMEHSLTTLAILQSGCNTLTNLSFSVDIRDELLSISGGYSLICETAVHHSDLRVARAARDTLRYVLGYSLRAGQRRSSCQGYPRCPTPCEEDDA